MGPCKHIARVFTAQYDVRRRFIFLDAETYVMPHNISMLNEHIVAGPAIYQAS